MLTRHFHISYNATYFTPKKLHNLQTVCLKNLGGNKVDSQVVS